MEREKEERQRKERLEKKKRQEEEEEAKRVASLKPKAVDDGVLELGVDGTFDTGALPPAISKANPEFVDEDENTLAAVESKAKEEEEEDKSPPR